MKRLINRDGTFNKNIDWDSLEVDGIDHRDYPDFCDAYISYGLDEDGNELTEQDCEDLTTRGYAYDIIVENQLYIRD